MTNLLIVDARGQEMTFLLRVDVAGKNLSQCDDEALYLDRAKISDLFAENSARVGAFQSKGGRRVSLKLARRLSYKFARLFQGVSLSIDALADALFFSVWTELCSLVPIRHLARVIAKANRGQPIWIVLDQTRYNYLSYWYTSGFEAFYLAVELKRQGGNVGFCCASDIISETTTLDFMPHPVWLKSVLETPDTRRAFGGAATVDAGVRGASQMRSLIGHSLNMNSLFGSGLSFDVSLYDFNNAPPIFKIPIVTSKFCGFEDQVSSPGRELKIPFVDLDKWLSLALGDTIKAIIDRAHAFVQKYNIRTLHVCDAFFFEASIMAGAVEARGGSRELWPHSSNNAYPQFQRLDRVGAVHCLTKTAASGWTLLDRPVATDVVSGLMFNPPQAAQDHVPGAPLYVVIWGAFHALNRMPVLDEAEHRKSYKKIFNGLTAMLGVKVAWKPKDSWEDTMWLRSVIGNDVPMVELTQKGYDVHLPNMIFVSVSFGSTALIEGVSRGVPAMIARDFLVEDYTELDADHIVIGSVEKVLSEIQKCLDPVYRRILTEGQIEWYRQETDFSILHYHPQDSERPK